jgi:valyl-tRNA synthetase
MIWTGIELVGDVPFRDGIIHSTVLAPDGRRMSKSLGTGIDPLEMIDAHGADATRYGLLKMSSTQDVRFSEGALAEGWKLAVKLWNVSRLFLANTAGAEPEARPQSLEERWILARLDVARAEVEEAWGRFDFSAGVKALYGLTFDDFCDWYAEAIKPRLYEDDPDAAATALAALERLLALLHPVMPHVTEEIWTHLPERESRLIVSAWPESHSSFDADADALERVRSAATRFRRSQVRIELSEDEARIFDAVVKPGQVTQDGNVEREVERLKREIARSEGMLANERFVANAPKDVVAAEQAKLERYRSELADLA